MNDNTIGKQIKAARKRAGYTQGELAEKLNIKQQNLSQWETGKRIPRPETLNKICSLLKIDSSDVLINAFLNSLKSPEAEKQELLTSMFRQLNEPGQNKVIDYTELLLSSGQYNRDPEQDPEE